MARKKVKLSWISNDSARKATLKKRRKGMLKKTKELSVLCDVKACAIVYSPDEYRPEVWPPEPERVMRVLSSFKSLPEMEKSKKMLNQEGFLRQRISKTQEQLQKLEKDNRESRTKLLMLQGLDAPLPAAAAAASSAVMGQQEMVQTPADWYMNVNPMMMMMTMNNNHPNDMINPPPLLPPAPHRHQVAQENVANVAAPMQHNQYAGHDEDQYVDPFLDSFFSP
ncbi:agamous-like MADS-box protein AGL80 [Dioscorea cayenensis subsp. rotundata]|uniref:Agamous-like MADS-box protein AGL80 n=1 Tax=Dioscorea cayennensis subsp. rotundata TaxID=55577 RepID=A0AB40BWR9_DIOCR|nr:agamous-like MADS-box protein AGL80 [Dioscorea cayenensis subsp. rotundata]